MAVQHRASSWDLITGFDVFEERTREIIKRVTDVSVKKATLEAMAEPVVLEARRILERKNAWRTGTLANGIVTKIATDGSQILIGWSESALYGSRLENGFHHAGSHKFIKVTHLRPALISQRTKVAQEGMKILPLN